MTPHGLEVAVAALALPGGLVLHPTETVYGLGGRASDGAAALRVAGLKGRPPGPLLVLALDPPLDHPVARALAAAFWPGPLSLLVPAWPGVAEEVRGPEGTVGVRLPLHPLTRALVAAVGPITSTSANRTGQEPIQDPAQCPFPVDAILDGGVLPPGRPSTLVRGDTGAVLREGAIPAAAIRRVVEGLTREHRP